MPSTTDAPQRPKRSTQNRLTQLPAPILLLTLPSLLAHPPTHPLHIPALRSSFTAIRKVVSLSSEGVPGASLTPELECRAWIMLAEIGMQLAAAALAHNASWAKGVEEEVERAIGKGLLIATKHPSLRSFRYRLTLIHCQLAHWQHNSKFSRSLLKRLTVSYSPSDPPHLLYTIYLASLTQLLEPSSSESTTPSVSSADLSAAMQIIATLTTLCSQNSDGEMIQLINVIRLTILIKSNSDLAQDALDTAEASLNLKFESSDVASPVLSSAMSSAPIEITNPDPPTVTKPLTVSPAPYLAALCAQVLALSVLHYTHKGLASSASPRLSRLHELLDARDLSLFADGIIEIPLNSSPKTPLRIKATHPLVLLHLGFLISAVSKREAVGRKPKRKMFASHGLNLRAEGDVETEYGFSVSASLRDVEDVEQRLAKIKGDLMCELVAVCTMRSEFDEAEKCMDELIAHTRNHDLFNSFSGRITLHHAHLAHAMGQANRALECYGAAAHLSGEGSIIWVCAKAGEVGLRFGLTKKNGTKPDIELLAMGHQLASSCREGKYGGALEGIGKVLDACLTSEIVKAKQHLKHALEIASRTQDNYLRLLILTLTSSHYLHTTSDHAKLMLQTCRQLAAGLGALPKSDEKSDVAGQGQAAVGLWVGQRFLELYNREGDVTKAREQILINECFASALKRIEERGVAAANRGGTIDKDGDHDMQAV